MEVCGRGWGYVVGGQAYVMDGDMWQGMGTSGRVWGHVAGCGGMWHTLPHAPHLPHVPFYAVA